MRDSYLLDPNVTVVLFGNVSLFLFSQLRRQKDHVRRNTFA